MEEARNEKKNVYIDIHVIQTVPPSCVNRDDTGSPKTAVYGGVNRARVSSQAWKHAMRETFRRELPAEMIGNRTKMLVPLVMEQIRKINPDADAEKLAKEALENAGLKLNKKDGKVDALFFISQEQAKALASLALEGEKDKKAYKKALEEVPSIDMVLFGRMVASDPSLNYDAAAQVAHSISTHSVHNEYDYFTAVDDCSPEDNAGAGHLGTVEYNSATLYRYATVNAVEVCRHLGKDAAIAIRSFVSSFIRSMPTGKQNTFANRTLPDAVYITVRKDQPVNLSGAFEKPIISDQGYAEKSVERLCEYAEQVYRDYIGKPEKALGIGNGMESIAERKSFPEVLDDISAYIKENGEI